MKNKSDKIETIKASWFVWLFPLFATAIGGWLIYKYTEDRGPVVEIAFEDASSIQAGKTFVRFRGVNIGKVKDITISSDNKDVIAIVQLHRHASHFAVAGTRFWLVSPKVGFKEITGLETFFGGAYIAAQPGNPDGEPRHDFNAQKTSDTTDEFENTTAYFLDSSNAESINQGDSVTFRGLEIGSVRRSTLAKGAQLVQVQVQIFNRYVKLIRTNSSFWRKPGVQAKLGLFKSEITVNSLDTILHGGIEVFTPDPPGPIAKRLSHFELKATAPKDYKTWNPRLE